MDEKVGQGRRFTGAYDALRRSVIGGMVAPGDQIRVNEAAATLRLSATPVREALSRLVGEGLLEERPRIGFFVPLPTAYDLIDLLVLAELHLVAAAHAPGRNGKPVDRSPAPAGAGEPRNSIIDAASRLFDEILSGSDNLALIAAGRRSIDQLAPLRRAESLLFADSEAELGALREQFESRSFGSLRAAIRGYHRKRRAHAVQLAYLISRNSGRNNIPDIV